MGATPTWAARDVERPSRKKPGTKYRYLSIQTGGVEVSSENFTVDRKSAVYIKEAIASAPKCKICSGYIHTNSITVDHKIRKQDGGKGSIDNGQITHPYCNTTVKN